MRFFPRQIKGIHRSCGCTTASTDGRRARTLVQQVARRQRLLAVTRVFLGSFGFVRQVFDVPAVKQDAAAVGVGL